MGADAREHGSMGAWERGRGRGRMPWRPGSRAAFTLVEVVLTILVVGVGLTASMRALPVIMTTSRAAREGLVAQRLATDLLAEIALLPYMDPSDDVEFGPEDDESSATRAGFDDIDDYDGWTASPPQKKDGTAETGSDGYTRSVLVQCVKVDDFTDWEGDSQTKPKLITITVSRADAPSVSITTVRLPGANREDPQ